jgi:hypothetical protein
MCISWPFKNFSTTKAVCFSEAVNRRQPYHKCKAETHIKFCHTAEVWWRRRGVPNDNRSPPVVGKYETVNLIGVVRGHFWILPNHVRFYWQCVCNHSAELVIFVVIRVRIDPLHPLECRKRRLNGAALRMRPEKLRPRVTAGVAR